MESFLNEIRDWVICNRTAEEVTVYDINRISICC